MKKTPEEIVEILHSITKVSIEDGELILRQYSDQYPACIRSFIPGSFTHQLLKMIEDYLLGEGEND